MKTKLFSDSLHSLLAWRIWLFLGVQDIKTRFRRSFIGPLWILFSLAFFVIGAGVVYGVMFGQPMDEFLPFLTTGFVIWGFIISSFTESSLAFVNAEGYIKQFSYPKQIYLLRVLVVYTVVLLIGFLAILFVQLFFNRFSIVGWLWMIPGLLLLLLVTLAHITIFAYLGARFRDIPYAMGGILQVLFFVTPIMFPVKILQDRGLDFVYQYNPLYYLIEIVRYPILQYQPASFSVYLYALVYTALAWIIATIVARSMDNKLVFLL